MAGNSQRRGAVRGTSRPARKVGSGGQRRRGLAGRGPTPPAEERTGHPAARRAARAAAGPAGPKTPGGGPGGARARAAARRDASGEGLVIGRHAVLDALTAGMPWEELLLLSGTPMDPRLQELAEAAGTLGCPVRFLTRPALDALCPGHTHQGALLRVPGFRYATLDSVLPDPARPTASLLVALDGLTDPHNLGAIARTAAAFGAGALVLQERRSAPVTAAAWKASAGALARLPVARVPNLTGALRRLRQSGAFTLGLVAHGGLPLAGVDDALLRSAVVLVIGSEATGISRLVGQTCDLRLTIALQSGNESLNASVAAGIALARIAGARGLS